MKDGSNTNEERERARDLRNLRYGYFVGVALVCLGCGILSAFMGAPLLWRLVVTATIGFVAGRLGAVAVEKAWARRQAAVRGRRGLWVAAALPDGRQRFWARRCQRRGHGMFDERGGAPVCVCGARFMDLPPRGRA